MERFCLKALVQHVQAQRIFEIGKFDGATTVELAKAAPQAEVFTLDVLPELAEMANVPSEAASAKDKRVGGLFRYCPEAQPITQVFGDSLRFDYAPFAAGIDLVFVDAAHDYEHVSVDSRNALAIMKPGGTVIWHDYVAARRRSRRRRTRSQVCNTKDYRHFTRRLDSQIRSAASCSSAAHGASSSRLRALALNRGIVE